jgi:hypothetical protein
VTDKLDTIPVLNIFDNEPVKLCESISAYKPLSFIVGLFSLPEAIKEALMSNDPLVICKAAWEDCSCNANCLMLGEFFRVSRAASFNPIGSPDMARSPIRLSPNGEEEVWAGIEDETVIKNPKSRKINEKKDVWHLWLGQNE